ncbi:unnamed protein product [Cunninghamella blakesleeana]
MGNLTPYLDVELEKEHLVMYGLSNESSGCVLRGVFNIHFKQPTKVKSIILRFIGTLHISWTQSYGNGRDQYFEDEKVLVNHQWTLFTPPSSLKKAYTFNAGTYSYEFELPLSGDLPETIKVGHYYNVQYRLKALIQRPHILPNYSMYRPVYIIRQPMTSSPSCLQNYFPIVSSSPMSTNHSNQQHYHQLYEPVIVTNQWIDKVDYCITIPTKIYHHGETIHVHLRITPLINGLAMKQLICTFKEYASCKPTNGWFGGSTKTHGKILNYIKLHQLEDIITSTSIHENEDGVALTSYDMELKIPIANSFNEIQCDTRYDAVRVRHKLKFILSFENVDGHLSELRAILPVTIQLKSNDFLPSYEQTSNGQFSFPYDPNLMLLLLRRNHSLHLNESEENPHRHQEDQYQPDETTTIVELLNNPSSTLSNLLTYHPTSMDHDIQQQNGTTTTTTTNLNQYHTNPSSSTSSPQHRRFSFPSFFHRDHSRLPNYDEVQCH